MEDRFLRIDFNKKGSFEVVTENSLSALLIYPIVLIPLFLVSIVSYPFMMFKYFRRRFRRRK